MEEGVFLGSDHKWKEFMCRKVYNYTFTKANLSYGFEFKERDSLLLMEEVRRGK